MEESELSCKKMSNVYHNDVSFFSFLRDSGIGMKYFWLFAKLESSAWD
jgi:hypothetical protein